MENSHKIIDKIQSDKIKPIPKYHFTTRKILIWGGFMVFILFGAISFSIILYTIQQSSFDLLNHLDHSKLEFFLVLFPLVWLVTLLVFLLASMWTVRYSKRGYKLSPGKWLAYSTTISIIIGTIFFISGGANWFEKSFANNIELYNSIEERKIKVWNTPEQGNLAGTILSFSGDTLTLKDFYENKWKIITTDSWVAQMVILEVGEMIKINGKITSENTFTATDIRPWGRKNHEKFEKNERNRKGQRNRR